MRNKIRGIIPPLATPLKDDETVDKEQVRRLVSFLLEKGVHGLFVLGSTGEFPALTDEAKRGMIGTVLQEVHGRVPVLVGVTEPGTKRAISWVRAAESEGADAFVAAPPYYFRHTENEILRHFQMLADASPRPLLLYNIPVTTQNFLSLSTIIKLSDHPNIIGIKDSTGDMAFFSQIVDAMEEKPFVILQGDDRLVALSLIRGGTGAINSCANLVPEWFVSVYDAVQRGDVASALFYQKKINQVLGLLESVPFFAGLKEGLRLRGVNAGAVSAPLETLSEQEKEQIKVTLVRHHLIP
ncbi:MAG: dihydrodipicolinate synthase family protein [Armatimonadetes bacterium]|nr:dihydrodipicolinate synthase family protein [Armatimonadota bacterium]MDW8122288.1 dihydrodipicolinate synthase family protein [Armatimonadota bacterium]